MFQSLRNKFIILSLISYLVLALISAVLFQHGVTDALDEQLEEISEVVIQKIKISKDSTVSLADEPSVLQISNLELLPTISLFDAGQNLVVQHGPERTATLARPGFSELPFSRMNLRTLTKPIRDASNNKVIGYLQIQLSTMHKDRAFSEFLEALFATTPLMLLAIGALGYVFASRATKPIEDTFSLLRRFMSDAGHELKTPIAVIHASCDNLLADLEGNKAATDRVEVISRSADRMQRLVADLLLLTKSERSSLTLKFLPLRFDMLLREVLGEFSDLFEEKGIELSADAIAAAKVNGDKDALHRMLANLFENALNYTNKGGMVAVSLSLSGANLVLKVADTGIGIPPEAMARIFERFFRVDESRARAAGGAGLGLAIVKAITESHHGQIAVSSEVGKGTTFTITLPVVGQTTLFGRKSMDMDEIAKHTLFLI